MIYKFVVVGAPRTGKTRLVQASTYTYSTVGVECHRLAVNDDMYCVWDTSGDSMYSQHIHSLIRGASAICAVYNDEATAACARAYVEFTRRESPSTFIIGINTSQRSCMVDCDAHYSVILGLDYMFQFSDLLRDVSKKHVLTGIYQHDARCCCAIL